MPSKPLSNCNEPGCTALVQGGGKCIQHKQTTAEKGYGGRWNRLSKQYRREYPLCRHCEQDGRTTLAQCVDHVIPHGGNVRLLYDVKNLQSLCWSCHSKKTIAERA